MTIKFTHGIDLMNYVHEELKLNTSGFEKFNQKWAFFQVFLHFSFMLYLHSILYVDDVIKFSSLIVYLFTEMFRQFYFRKEMRFFDSHYNSNNL